MTQLKSHSRDSRSQDAGWTRPRRRIGSRRVKSQGRETSQLQVAAVILTPSPNGHAANTLAVELDGRESGPVRSERRGDGCMTPGKLAEEHEGLVLK